MNEKNDKDHTPSPTPLAKQPHHMSPNEAQSKLNTINYNDKTDSESEVFDSHQSENSLLPPSSQLPSSPLQLQIPPSLQLPHYNHNFKNHHYHNHHYQQKHLH